MEKRGGRARRRTLTLPDGRALALIRWPGSGVPLVLLHGLLDSAEGWEELARDSGHPCVAFDLPGFGDSDLPARPRISAYAQDVAAGIEALGIERCVLVGHSLGGAIAVAVAESIPDRIAALVLLAPAGFGRIHLAEAISLPGVRNVVQRALPLALSNRLAVTVAYMGVVTSGRLPESDIVERVTAAATQSTPGAREGTRAVVAAGLSKRGFQTRRVGYYGPVAAVWGDRGRLVPLSHSDALRESLPQVSIEVWPGMGHHPQRERPAELALLIGEVCSAADRSPKRSSAAA